MLEYEFGGRRLRLCEEKVLLIPEEEMLLCADLHLGKVSHFRKAGLAVPLDLYKEDLRALNDVIIKYQPKNLIILGDLFHSTYNMEWEEFKRFVQTFQETRFILIKGNHDTLFEERYRGFGLEIHRELSLGSLLLTHEAVQSTGTEIFNLHGHIHPAIKLFGPARQNLRLPCFYFTRTHGILPSFGRFTGSANIRPEPGDDVFAVTGQGVIKV